jgi:uncharacterized membrane protein YedE/YeeE
MMKWLLQRAIDNVERDWNDDASYLRDMIDASPRTAWLVSRMAGLLAALVVGCVLATTVVASGSDQPATVSNLAFTPKRIVASGSALVGLIGAVIGGLALARSRRTA